jgi:hypothetical protein
LKNRSEELNSSTNKKKTWQTQQLCKQTITIITITTTSNSQQFQEGWQQIKNALIKPKKMLLKLKNLLNNPHKWKMQREEELIDFCQRFYWRMSCISLVDRCSLISLRSQ